MMKLTDTQTQILAAAAVRPDKLALPPERLPPAPRRAVGKALLKAGLVAAAAELDVEPGVGWAIDGKPTLLRITEAGLAAIGVGERGAAEEAHEGPPTRTEAAGVPAAADTAQTTQAGLQEAARVAPSASGRQTLRDATTAVLAAWDASGDHAGMQEAIGALRAALAAKPPRPPRQPGAPRRPREGTKQQQVLGLLRRSEGATIAEITDATAWQPHTVRGFLAGLKKRHGIAVEVLERVRQVGPDREGSKGSYSVYRIANAG